MKVSRYVFAEQKSWYVHMKISITNFKKQVANFTGTFHKHFYKHKDH